MELTVTEFVNTYIQPNGKPKRHIYYDKTVKAAAAIRLHADAEPPGDLITKRRPSESAKIQEYRKDIDEPITQSDFTKVYECLMKIRKSPDWSIKFEKNNSLITDTESLQNYLMTYFPKYTSITNWYFQIGLRTQLIDVNSKVLVRPLTFDAVPDNEYIKPYPYIFTSEQVLDYQFEKWYVLKSDETVTYTEQQQKYYDGERYYVVTDTHIQIFDQATRDKKFILYLSYPHDLGFVPVYDFKGRVLKETFSNTLYESKIQSMIPFLNEARREYSDIQAEVVQHVHSTMWANAPNDCTGCNGTGKVIRKVKNANTTLECEKCNGKGYPFSPYENLLYGRQQAGAAPIPNPPAGFIEKDTKIVEIQDERIEKHKYRAYAAINLEFLASVPLNESGTAKSYDRDEGNNFVHGVAEDGVEFLDNYCFCANEYRNKKVVKSDSERKKLLPTINVPEKYDLLSDSMVLEDIAKMKTAKLDAGIINAAEIDYSKKRFNTEPKIADMLSLKLALDPFAGESEDNISSKLFRNTVDIIDVTIHDNISEFIERALEENKSFVTLPNKSKKELLIKYAEEKLKAISESGQLEPEPAEVV